MRRSFLGQGLQDRLTLVFQNPPNAFSGGVWSPERPPQEVFGGPNTYSQGIWKTRVIDGVKKKTRDGLLNGILGLYLEEHPRTCK